ncbi:hypothetical protein MPER_06825, partial [Moniliophthora perniciosa FA553]
MPPALYQWKKAALAAGEGYNHNDYTPAGYALPDPNIIAATNNPVTRAAFFTALLKLRPLLLYRLSSPKFKPLSVNQWRVVLGIEVHGQNEKKPAFQRRQELQTLLQECIDEGGMKGLVDLSRLDSAPMVWRGGVVPTFSEEPPKMAQEILWDLAEVNFHWELLSLDHIHYQGLL